MNDRLALINQALEDYKRADDAVNALKVELELSAKRARLQGLVEDYFLQTGDKKLSLDAGEVTYIEAAKSVRFNKSLEKMLDQHPWLIGFREESKRSASIRVK
jgi:hypothetical protein